MNEVIRELPRDDRPRERMQKHGPETLSNAELLAILIGSGLRGKNAIQLARELLVGKGMSTLKQRELNDLASVGGVGPAKAARIAAAFEIARRMTSGEPEEPPAFDPTVFGKMLVGRCARYRQERFGIALLDSRHRIIDDREMFVGTINNSLVSTRDILRATVVENAAAIVAYHNHPSGDCTPSHEDESFTQKLRDSLKLADIELIDHLVVGTHRYCSMKDRGMI
jgi:DNA repair protein RadC